MDGEKLNSYLKVSLIILNLFVINLYTTLFSILTLGVLAPVLIGASYCEVQSILDYDMVGINKRFFNNVKNNIKYIFGKIFLLNIFCIIVFTCLLFFNNKVQNLYEPTFYYFIVFTQVILLFEGFNIVQVALVQIFVHKEKNINKALLNAFLIVNTNIIRFLFGNISFVITLVLLNKIPIFGLVFLSMNIALYYISIRQTVVSFYEKTNNYIIKK